MNFLNETPYAVQSDRHIHVVESVIGTWVFDSWCKDFVPCVRAILGNQIDVDDMSEVENAKMVLFQPTDKKLFTWLGNMFWDGVMHEEWYLPFRFNSIFVDCNMESEYAISQRLLMLAGDVESNPGPIGASIADSFMPGFSGLANQFTGVTESVNDMCNVMQTAAGRTSSAVEQTMRDMSELAQSGRLTVDNIQGMLEKFLTRSQNLSIYHCFMKPFTTTPVASLTAVTNLFTAKTYGEFTSWIIQIVALMGIEEKVILSLKDRWRTMGNSVDGRFTMRENDKIISLVCLFSSLLGKTATPVDFLSAFIKNLHNAKIESAGLSSLIKEVEDLAEQFGFGFSERAKFVAEMKNDIGEMITSIAEMKLLAGTHCAAFCRPIQMKKFRDLGAKIRDFEIRVTKSAYKDFTSTNMITEINRLSKDYNDLAAQVEASTLASADRVKPVGIVLVGPSQIGKSEMMEELIKQIQIKLKQMALNDPDDEYLQEFSDAQNYTVWNVNPRDQYDQGYIGQEIMATDDGFAAKSNEDHQTFLNVISNRGLGAYAAEMNRKGHPFRLKFCVVSANSFPRASVTINNVHALPGRFPIFVHVSVRNGMVVPDVAAGFDSEFRHLSLRMQSAKDYIAERRNRREVTINDIATEAVRLAAGYQRMFIDKLNRRNAQELIMANMVRQAGSNDDSDDDSEYSDSHDAIDPSGISRLGMKQKFHHRGCYVSDNLVAAAVYKELLVKKISAPVISEYSQFPRCVQFARCMKANTFHLQQGETFAEWCERTDPDITSCFTVLHCFQTVSYLQSEFDSFVKAIHHVHSYDCSWEDCDYLFYGTKLYLIDIDNDEAMKVDMTTVERIKLVHYPKCVEFVKMCWDTMSQFVARVCTQLGFRLSEVFDMLRELSYVQVSMIVGAFMMVVYAFARMMRCEYDSADTKLRRQLISLLRCIEYQFDDIQYAAASRFFDEWYDQLTLDQFVPRFVAYCADFFEDSAEFKRVYTTYESDGTIQERRAKFPQNESHCVKAQKDFELLEKAQAPLFIKNNRQAILDAYRDSGVDALAYRTYVSLIDSLIRRTDDLNKILLNVPVNESCVHLGVLDHSHIGIPDDGKKYVHLHLCEKCGKTYSHAHMQHGLTLSLTYGNHLCSDCRLVDEESPGGRSGKARKRLSVKMRREDDVLEESPGGRSGKARKKLSVKMTRQKCGTCDKEGHDVSTCLVALSKEHVCERCGRKGHVEQWCHSTPIVVRRELNDMYNLGSKKPRAPLVVEGMSKNALIEQLMPAFAMEKARDIPRITKVVDPEVENLVDVKDNLRDFNSELTKGIRNEVAYDSGALTLLSTMLSNNLVKVTVNGRSMQSYLHGWGVGKFVVCPSHIFSNKIGVMCELVRVRNGFPEREVYYGVSVVCRKDWDLACVQILPRTHKAYVVPVKMDLEFNMMIMKHLLTNESMIQYAHTALQYYPQVNLAITCKVKPIVTDEGENVLHITALENTMCHSQGGDCGGPIILLNSKYTRKLLGMHTAGEVNSAFGVSTMVTVERMEFLTQSALQSSAYVPVTVHQNAECPIFPKIYYAGQSQFNCFETLCFDGYGNNMPGKPGYEDVEYLGDYVIPSLPCSMTGATDHKRTPFFGAFEERMIPSALLETDARVTDLSGLMLDGHGRPSILVTQTTDYCKPPRPVDMNVLNDMTAQLIDYSIDVMHGEILGPSRDHNTNLWESINGQFDDPHYEKLNLKSSSGTPWSNLGKSKKDQFMEDVNVKYNGEWKSGKWFKDDDTTKYLYNVLMEKLESGMKGEKTFSIWKSCKKDELRKPAKVKIGATRLFTAGPIESVLLLRYCFGRYKAAWTRHRKEFFHSVGINPHSVDWAKLANDLSMYEDILDADYGKFDKFQLREFAEAAAHIIIQTIIGVNPDSKEYEMLFYTLFDEIIETVCLNYDTMFLKKHGNCSGNPLTTPLNCWINFLLHWYCFIKLTGKTSLAEFLEYVIFSSFGDDVVQAVARVVQEQYNFANIQKVMTELGQEYTAGDKTLENHFKKLSEVSFLKRRFVREGTIWTAPIDKLAIESMFNWSCINDDDLVGWKNSVNEQLMEASLHGKEYYNFVAGSLNKKIATNEFKLLYPQLKAEVMPVIKTPFTSMKAQFLDRYGALGLQKVA